MAQDFIYYWRAYRQNTASGPIFKMNQDSGRMQRMRPGDRVWAITLSGPSRYALVARFIVSDTGENAEGSEAYETWGRWYFEAEPQGVLFFDPTAQETVEPVVRQLGLPIRAEILGQAFQGAAGVAVLPPQNVHLLETYAAGLSIDTRLTAKSAAPLRQPGGSKTATVVPAVANTAPRASLGALTNSTAVLQAIQEFDALGRERFLETYGYGEADGYWLLYDQGRYDRYDSKAIVGVAFKFVPGIDRPLRADEFSGGRATVMAALQRLGFEVEVNAQAAPGIRRPTSMAPQDADDEPFDPTNAKDAREKVLREIRARRGQKQFRDALIEAYEGRCAITGCDVLDVLEAAHITPYLGPETNHVTNGLLLRADLHTLFDTYLVAVAPETLKVLVSPSIKDPMYRALHGQALRATKTKASAPSEAALRKHRASCSW